MDNTTPPEIPVQTKVAKTGIPLPIWVWLILGVLLIGVCTTAGYYLGTKNTKKATTGTPTTPTRNQKIPVTAPISKSMTADNQKAAGTEIPATPVTDKGVTWLSSPAPLADLGLLTIPGPKDNNMIESDIHYFKVGADNGNDIIIAEYTYMQGDLGNYLFLKQSTNQYNLLTNYSQPIATGEGDTSGSLLLTSKVVSNNFATYSSLQAQPKLTVSGIDLSVDNVPNVWFPDYEAKIKGSAITILDSTPYGILYDVNYSNGKIIDPKEEAYVLVKPNNIGVFYQLIPPFLKNSEHGWQTGLITWNDGTITDNSYSYDGGTSCGAASGIAILNASDMSDLSPAGKTEDGETIYQFYNPNNPVLQEFYKNYTDMNGSGNPISPTLTEYLNNHALIVYQDKMNRLVLLYDQKYGITGCGKPVVYLYPTQITQVSVKVGANISKSVPAYNQGWSVIAQPDGMLTTADGKTYDSLFWEGFGQNYPTITQGFVVAQADLPQTLSTHLMQLGLNTKERADFLAFWLPKMPTTPFVRLTWFGTQAMNNLAPLTITPKPDTLIRIFLDFQGLQTPISIALEHLSAIPRHGFTVVEWGGLLR